MNFKPESFPFPRWYGPYSPARGNNSGFRVRNGLLGATVVSEDGQEFWTAQQTQGVFDLVHIVRTHWQGGRVVILPNGFVVKPLQNESERVLIGRASDTLVLTGEGGSVFNFANLGYLTPGSAWPGPGTIGLECVIRDDGSLTTRWYRPIGYGHEETQEQIAGPSSALVAGFQRARPGKNSGRVRVTVGGHVITSRTEHYRGLSTYYVGRILPTSFRNWNRWIEGR